MGVVGGLSLLVGVSMMLRLDCCLVENMAKFSYFNVLPR